MIEIDIPDFGKLEIAHLVLDYNGTIALDGKLIQGVRERLTVLAGHIAVHVVTADTFGTVAEKLAGLPVTLYVLPPVAQDLAKTNYADRLGSDKTACIGNGRNDAGMLKKAALGIAVVQEEGTAVASIMSADIVAPDIVSALDLFMNPLRLTATLRS